MRLFIAINFTEEVKKEISASISSLTCQFPQLSWVKQENLHLTLKFLGNINKKVKSLPRAFTPSEVEGKSRGQKSKVKTTIKSFDKAQDKNSKIEKIKKGIKKSVEGIKPFELEFERLGYFNRGRLIILLGFKVDKELKKLAKNIDPEMRKLSFLSEKREFSPHITIGRGKMLPKKVKSEIKKVLAEKFSYSLQKPIFVSEIVLMESSLTAKGAVYTQIARFSFEDFNFLC